MARVLVTGSAGLVGRALGARLRELGIATSGLDLRGDGDERGDVRDRAVVERAAAGCEGIVHLAAVSRVVDAERDPARCWSVNVDGTRTVLDVAAAAAPRPWLIFASSREVYGHPTRLPVDEDAPLAPINAYGRAKVAGEEMVTAHGGAIVRLSNAYGAVADHVDRVVPAFARAALRGEPLRVEGAGHRFDFVHLDDVVAGLLALIEVVRRAPPPPIHLVTGTSTTLGELAALAVELAGTGAPVLDATPRTYDVSHFAGDPARAHRLLGWRARVSLRDGLARFLGALRSRRPAV